MSPKVRLRQRLKDEGRWGKFVRKRERLKRDGMHPARAWIYASACFPPLDGSNPEMGDGKGNVHLRFLTIDGETRTLQGWASETGISKQLIRDRLKRGWNAELAIYTPARRYKDNQP